MDGSFQSQPATPKSPMEHSSSEFSSVSHPGTSSTPLMGSELYPQLVHDLRDAVTTTAGGRKDTMSNSPPTLEGSSVQVQGYSAADSFPSSSQRLATTGLSDQSSAATSTVAQSGTPGIPFVSPPYNQGIMYPPTAVIRGVPYAAGHLAQAIPLVPHHFVLEPTGFNNGQHSLVPRHTSQAVGPYIDNRQYFTMANQIAAWMSVPGAGIRPGHYPALNDSHLQEPEEDEEVPETPEDQQKPWDARLLMEVADVVTNESELMQLGLTLGVGENDIRRMISDKSSDLKKTTFDVLSRFNTGCPLDEKEKRQKLRQALCDLRKRGCIVGLGI